VSRRRFEVSGIDNRGDLHSFRTDERERAETMCVRFKQDFEEVRLIRHRL
jgi:hypothetical protein